MSGTQPKVFVTDASGRKWLWRACLRGLTGDAESGDRPMPAHQGVSGFALHHFTRREAVNLLTDAGFRVREVQALGIKGQLPWPSWLGWLRAYGYLLAAQR